MKSDHTSSPKCSYGHELQGRQSSLARRKFEPDQIPLLDQLKARDPRAHSKYMDTKFGKLDNISQDDIIFLLKHAPPTHETPYQTEANETLLEANIFRIQTDDFKLQPEEAFWCKLIARLAINTMTLRGLKLIDVALFVGHLIWTTVPIWIVLEVYEAIDHQFQLWANTQLIDIFLICYAILVAIPVVIWECIIDFMICCLLTITKEKFKRYCDYWFYFEYNPYCTRAYNSTAWVERVHLIYSLWSSLYPELAGLPTVCIDEIEYQVRENYRLRFLMKVRMAYIL